MENLNLILKKISLFLNNLPFDQSYLKHIFNLENEKNPLVILLINTFSQKLSKSNEENTFYFIVFTLIIVTKVFEEDEYFDVQMIYKVEKLILDYYEKIKNKMEPYLIPIELRSSVTIRDIIASRLNCFKYLFDRKEITELITLLSKLFIEDESYEYIIKVISLNNASQCDIFEGYIIELDKAIDICEESHKVLLNKLNTLNSIKILVLIEV